MYKYIGERGTNMSKTRMSGAYDTYLKMFKTIMFWDSNAFENLNRFRVGK